MVETTSVTPGAAWRMWSIRATSRYGAPAGSSLKYMSVVPMCSNTTSGR